jgi:hypothetical protein
MEIEYQRLTEGRSTLNLQIKAKDNGIDDIKNSVPEKKHIEKCFESKAQNWDGINPKFLNR